MCVYLDQCIVFHIRYTYIICSHEIRFNMSLISILFLQNITQNMV